MADYIPNAENFKIDVILGNLDIDENIEIQNEVLENISDEHILTELPTTPEMLFIDEDDVSKVHIDKKDQASTTKNLKKATRSGNSFVCIYCEKQYLRQKPYRCMFQFAARKEKSKLKKVGIFIVYLSLWLIIVALHEVS